MGEKSVILDNVKRLSAMVAPANRGKQPTLVGLDVAVQVPSRSGQGVRSLNYVTSIFIRDREERIPDDVSPPGAPLVDPLPSPPRAGLIRPRPPLAAGKGRISRNSRPQGRTTRARPPGARDHRIGTVRLSPDAVIPG